MSFGVAKELLEQIVRAVSSNPKVQKAVIFGSRARGDCKEDSDIDIALYADGLTSEELNSIRLLAEEIDTVLKIDILDVERIGRRSLAENIRREGKSIFER
ncbi:MAG: nucleotidyltransferase domain-containing protein [Clostridia bacterium]|nr:nucleotidyltransferase domain-containing protein [Clostridia bacterium]